MKRRERPAGRFSALACAGLVVAFGAMRLPAVDIINYSPAIHDRFISGYPGAPVANPTYWLHDYDLSGVGWQSDLPGRSVALISPQHFLAAQHYVIPVGKSVVFADDDGGLHSYVVASYTTLTYDGQVSDLVVGRLATAVTPADGVTHFPILDLPTLGDYLGQPLAIHGWNARTGSNTLDALWQIDLPPASAIDNIVFAYDQDPATGEAFGQVGDSGSPTFGFAGGQLALLGTHSAIDTDPNTTYDVFVPYYIPELAAILSADGYTLGLIPEPATYAVGLGGLVLAAVAVHRRGVRRKGDRQRTIDRERAR